MLASTSRRATALVILLMALAPSACRQLAAYDPALVRDAGRHDMLDPADAGTDDMSIADAGPPLTAWTVLSSAAGDAEARAVATDGKAAFVAGTFSLTTNFGKTDEDLVPYKDSTNGFLVSYDLTSHAVRWQQKLSGAGTIEPQGVAVGLGQVVVVGTFNDTFDHIINKTSAKSEGKDIFIAAFNSETGTPLWQQTIGGQGDDSANAVAIGDSVWVTGSVYGDVDFLNGQTAANSSASAPAAYVAAFDLAGQTRWVDTYRGTGGATAVGAGIAALGSRVAVCANFGGGPLTLAGKTLTPPGLVSLGYTDVAVFTLDGKHQPKWAASFGGSHQDSCHGIALDDQGRVAVAAETSSNDLLVDQRTLAGIALYGDAVIVALDDAGKVIYSERAGPSGVTADAATGVAFTVPGQLLVAGHYATEDFLLPGLQGLPLQGLSAGFLATIDLLSKKPLTLEGVEVTGSPDTALTALATHPKGALAVGYAGPNTGRRRALVKHNLGP